MNSAVDVQFCKRDKCQEGMEYFCHACQNQLCRQCQQEHATSLDTKHHSISLYRNKSRHHPSKGETCSIHVNRIYTKFCKPCNIPICGQCKGHKQHKQLELLTAFGNRQKQLKEQIVKIQSDIVYQFQVLLSELKNDIKFSREEKKHLISAMNAISRRIKNSMDEVISDGSYYKNFHRCSLQEIKLKKHICKIQYYDETHDRLKKRPVRFLRFIKTIRPPTVEDTPSLTLHSILLMTPDINMDDVMKPLTKIKLTNKGKRHVENKKLLKIILPVNAIDSFIAKGVDRCYHISCVTPDRVWINDESKLILADTKTGETLHNLPCSPQNPRLGFHSVNNKLELFYIENKFTISKLSKDMKSKFSSTFKKYSAWCLTCIYCSPSTGQILIGKTNSSTKESKIEKYNKQGKLEQSIQKNNNEQSLYNLPGFITENSNGDVVVSDVYGRSHGAVVVTDRDGRHRFSYTGRPNGPDFLPLGICTDAFSNILVCDSNSSCVHVINENGQFYRVWSPQSESTLKTIPMSLSYDVSTHLVWVGSVHDNAVSAFRYIHRHSHLTGMSYHP